MGPVKKLECLFCWKQCVSPQKGTGAEDIEIMTKIFNSCSKHLTSNLMGNSPHWIWNNFKNNNGPFCSDCFKLAKNLSLKNDLLDSIEKEVKSFVSVLTTQVLTARTSTQASKVRPKQQSFKIVYHTIDDSPPNEKEEVDVDVEENEVDDLSNCFEVFDDDVMDHDVMEDRTKNDVSAAASFGAMELDVLVQAAAAAECMMNLSGVNPAEDNKTKIRKFSVSLNKTPPDPLASAIGEFLCGTCGLTYVTKYELVRHEKRHILNFTCDECGEKFSSQYKLEAHKRRKNDPYDFKCDMCGEKHKYESALKMHKLHMGHYAPEESKDFEGAREKLKKAKAYKRQQARSNRPPARMCDECGKCFQCPSHVKYHKIFNHSNEKPFECETCGRKFKLNSQLRTHSLVHSEETILRCKECDKTFSTNFYLQRHIRLNHSSNNFKCDICDYVTLIKASFEAHMLRLHDPKKKFVCAVCGIRLSSKNSLVNHERIHTGEKPCACIECGESFRTKVLLTQHVNVTHKGGFQCHVCDYVAGAKFTLDEHLKKHSEDRPFRCADPCERMFKQKSSLITHLKRGCKYNAYCASDFV